MLSLQLKLELTLAPSATPFSFSFLFLRSLFSDLVLTPLCSAVCALLRSAKASPPARRDFVLEVLCLVQCLAKYFKQESDTVCVATYEELTRVEDSEACSALIKDQLLEKVGGGLISLIATVLPASGDPNSTEINEDGVRLSADAMRQLIQIARLDIKR